MLNNRAVDPAILKILKKYSKLTQEYFAGGCTDKTIEDFANDRPTSPEELEMMATAGVAFDAISITHDDAVEKCFTIFKPEHKAKVARQFVSGLGAARPELRSGLSAFALMQSMPQHRFRPNQAGFCEVCASREVKKSLDLTTLSRERYFLGSLPIQPEPSAIQFFLSQQELLLDEKPNHADIELLNAVLDTARNSVDTCTAPKLQKAVKGIPSLKLDNGQARRLVETLGYCGILQSEKHKGYIDHWTNPGLSPNKPSSDWAYPVDFWSGKEGVNEKAVDFWFGNILK